MNIRPMLIYSAIVIGVMFLASAWAWTQLPADAMIPIHWDLSGQADGFAPKTIGLLLLPLVTVGVTALFAVIPRVEPRRANLERSSRAFGATWVGVVSLLGAIHLLAVAQALGATFDVSRLVIIGVGILFVVIGNYLPTVRPNYMVGIRLPWTLASDLSWVKTHRVGGRLFVIEGVVLVLLGLLGVGPEALFATIIAAIVVLLTVVSVYSYRVWKADPGKRQP